MKPNEILDALEADDWDALYRCRHDPVHREATLETLSVLLQNPRPAIRHRAMNALGRIRGAFDTPNALASLVPTVCNYASSDDLLTRQIAVGVLHCIGKHNLSASVPTLIAATSDASLLDSALLALVDIADATSDVIRCFHTFVANPKAKIRRIAIRGLAAVNANDPHSLSLIRDALADRSKVVRDVAEKTLVKLLPQP